MRILIALMMILGIQASSANEVVASTGSKQLIKISSNKIFNSETEVFYLQGTCQYIIVFTNSQGTTSSVLTIEKCKLKE